MKASLNYNYVICTFNELSHSSYTTDLLQLKVIRLITQGIYKNLKDL